MVAWKLCHNSYRILNHILTSVLKLKENNVKTPTILIDSKSEFRSILNSTPLIDNRINIKMQLCHSYFYFFKKKKKPKINK